MFNYWLGSSTVGEVLLTRCKPILNMYQGWFKLLEHMDIKLLKIKIPGLQSSVFPRLVSR